MKFSDRPMEPVQMETDFGATPHLANLFAAPIEIIETEFPCRIRKFELTPDSGGAGRYRGGLNFARNMRL